MPDKKAEEIAAEEACRDLPLDAFDEEFDALEDDVDEELLTAAEQFDERDRVAAMKLETQRTYPAEVTSNVTLRNENYSSASKDAFFLRVSPPRIFQMKMMIRLILKNMLSIQPTLV